MLSLIKFTPDNIGPYDISPDGIFVFGSNLKGIHGSGAAKFAKTYYGAQQFVGEGLTGRCYAFPTLGSDSSGGNFLQPRSHEALVTSVLVFHQCVMAHSEYTFWLTKVGCGLARYREQYMIDLFSGVIEPNLIKPKGW